MMAPKLNWETHRLAKRTDHQVPDEKRREEEKLNVLERRGLSSRDHKYSIQQLLNRIHPCVYDIKEYSISTVGDNGQGTFYYDEDDKVSEEQCTITRAAFNTRDYTLIKKAIFNTGLIPRWVFGGYCDLLKNCNKQMHFARYIKQAQRGEWDIACASNQEQGHFYSMVIMRMVKTKQMCDELADHNKERRVVNIKKQAIKLADQRYNQLKPILQDHVCLDVLNIIAQYMSFTISSIDGKFIVRVKTHSL